MLQLNFGLPSCAVFAMCIEVIFTYLNTSLHVLPHQMLCLVCHNDLFNGTIYKVVFLDLYIMKNIITGVLDI